LRERLRASLPAYLFSLPALLFVGLFVTYPLVASFWLSLTDYHLLYSDDTKFIGITNYAKAFGDRSFRIAFRNTLIFSLFRVPVVIIVSMFLASLIQSAGKFGRVCQTLLFVPVLVPEAMGAVIYVWLLSERFGLLNHLIGTALGITFAKNWLGEPGWAMAGVVLTSYWGMGVSIVLYSAGLAGIPKSLYDAAAVDGADAWDRFWAVTFPSLRHTTAVVGILAIINSLKVFALPFVMTRGGPARSTLMLYHWTFSNAFQYFKLGYASAMAYLLGVIVIIIAGIQLAASRRESSS